MDHDSDRCPEVEALLPLVADGAIDADQDPELFAHLATCPSCQEALYRHDMVALTLAAVLPVVTPRTRTGWRWRLVAAAAALALLGIGLHQLVPTTEPVAADPQLATEVLEVLPPAEGSTEPRFLVRQGDRTLIVDGLDGQSLEAGEVIDDRSPPPAVPVRGP